MYMISIYICVLYIYILIFIGIYDYIMFFLCMYRNTVFSAHQPHVSLLSHLRGVRARQSGQFTELVERRFADAIKHLEACDRNGDL